MLPARAFEYNDVFEPGNSANTTPNNNGAGIDFSIDTELKQKYDLKAVEEDLPPLPSVYYDEKKSGSKVKNNIEEITVPKKTLQSSVTTITTPTAKIDSGKKFKAKNLTTVSSSTPEGAKITFETVCEQQFGKVVIPAKTRLRAVVTDSHPPQFTGNGGLVVLNINEMVYNGQSFPISAKITSVDGKNIFFNNIKGKHTYKKGMAKAIKPAGHFMSKMWKTTCRLSQNMPEALLTPVTLLTGAVVYAGGVGVSPLVAFFSKGGPLNIPANTHFTIKLTDDAYMY